MWRRGTRHRTVEVTVEPDNGTVEPDNGTVEPDNGYVEQWCSGVNSGMTYPFVPRKIFKAAHICRPDQNHERKKERKTKFFPK